MTTPEETQANPAPPAPAFPSAVTPISAIAPTIQVPETTITSLSSTVPPPSSNPTLNRIASTPSPFTPITKRKLNQVLSAFDIAVSNDDTIRISDTKFMTRLSTFKINPVSPVVCARHGWTNVGKDRIGLATLVERYVENLKEAHGVTCQWKSKVVEESVYKFPITSSAVAIRATRQRLIGLSKTLTTLPQITSQHLITSDSPIYHMTLETEISTVLERWSEVDKSRLLTLAIYGWETLERSGEEQNDYVKCFLCHRVVVGRSGKRRRLEGTEEESFNPVEEHRWYCPWVFPQSDGVKKGKLGHEINLESLVKGKQKSQGITPDISGHAGSFNILKTHHFLKQYGF
ncbi:hypothetical protein BC829DRAFT_440359 [Chytridium lagenaria]|nr:hypothetical protein BC829DRAFT_440359 [Chytridium lagenaria]